MSAGILLLLTIHVGLSISPEQMTTKPPKKKKKKALLYKRQAGKAQLHLLWNKLKSLLPSAQNFDK